MSRLPERAEAAARVDRAAPSVREAEPLELREGGEEVAGKLVEGPRALFELETDAIPEVVDGVVAAPENSRVRGEPVVVELVAAVADALPVCPADGRPLRAREWFGDEHIVVHRKGERPEPAQERPVRIGGQR